MSEGLVDGLGRPLRDLRISVTDRCNFRCRYCMPKEVFGPGYPFLPAKLVLTFDEITRLAALFVSLGVRKLRITGGEPLVRPQLDRLIARLAALEGVEDLALTTNGALLADKAAALRAAGLKRVTVSLDTLDDALFRQMSDVDISVERVLAGIEAARRAGFRPIKINMVVQRGKNDHCILEMARHFRGPDYILRFIEYMDVGTTNGWRLEDVVPAAEILRTIDAEMPLEPLAPAHRGEVAKRYRYRDGGGEIGIVASVTRPFCGDCTRARLSADGLLYTCLFAVHGHDLRTPLRGGQSDEAMRELIRQIWSGRVDRYSELRTQQTARLPKVEMSRIGG
ncbi:MAG TPA: GTP 3',8-cyclase MoaA [Limnochordia bacterium]